MSSDITSLKPITGWTIFFAVCAMVSSFFLGVSLYHPEVGTMHLLARALLVIIGLLMLINAVRAEAKLLISASSILTIKKMYDTDVTDS